MSFKFFVWMLKCTDIFFSCFCFSLLKWDILKQNYKNFPSLPWLPKWSKTANSFCNCDSGSLCWPILYRSPIGEPTKFKNVMLAYFVQITNRLKEERYKYSSHRDFWVILVSTLQHCLFIIITYLVYNENHHFLGICSSCYWDNHACWACVRLCK